ncbi:MAG: hypothetical protein IJ679_01430 [Lachnospiraceae bacterium]|nr:hypothetical protein [Lachnospiraceae bacterium]
MPGKSPGASPRFFLYGILFGVSLLLSGCSFLQSAIDGVEKRMMTAMIGAPKEVVSVSENRIAYQNLGPKEQKAYDQILDCILTHSEEVPLFIKSAEKCDKAFSAVMADYGGLFWVSGYSYRTYGLGDETVGFVFEPSYTMGRKKRDKTQEKIDAVVEEWLSDLPNDADDYTKSKFVFETLIDHVDYEKNSEDNQNIISVFLRGETVCQGYADATNYLLQQLSIPSMIVTGDARGISHAWNLVLLDGEYYFLDSTWGNSMYLDTDLSKVKHVNYAYLNITTEELLRTHTMDTNLYVPECTATGDNYFHREGIFFSDWQEEKIGIALSNGYYNNEKIVSVKLSDEALYEQVKQYFIDDGHLTDYCEGLESITYMDGPDTRVLTVEYR